MGNVVVLASSFAIFSSGFGEESAPQPSAGLSITILLLGVAAWVLSLFIAFWIVRAGVRAGIQQLVEQGRQQRDLIQAQVGLLNQLLKQQAGKNESTPEGKADADSATAWEKMRSS